MKALKTSLCLAAVIGLVDPTCTLEKVCTPGYTATVRPPASYTTKLKKAQMKALGLPGDPGQYEEDHMISLELCGDPRDPRNLIPELWPQATKKDVIENRLHKAVCAGTKTLEEAQKEVVAYE